MMTRTMIRNAWMAGFAHAMEVSEPHPERVANEYAAESRAERFGQVRVEYSRDRAEWRACLDPGDGWPAFATAWLPDKRLVEEAATELGARIRGQSFDADQP